jgi:hypothetical protein
VATDKLNIILEVQNKATREIESVAGSLKTLALGYASFQGVQALLRGVVATVKALAEATAAQEKADIALNAALKNMGDTSRATRQRIQEFSGEMMRSTNFVDDQVQSAMTLLITLGRLSGDGLERATKASADLAETLGIDLQSAASLVAKAAQGNTTMLGRYGIVISETIPKGEKFAEVLRLIEERMGGRAQAAAQSFQGRLKEVADQWDEVVESMGNFLKDSPELQKVLTDLAGSLERIAKTTNDPGFKELAQPFEAIALVFTEAAVQPFRNFVRDLEWITAHQGELKFIGSLLNLPVGPPPKTQGTGVVPADAPTIENARKATFGASDRLAAMQKETAWMDAALKKASDAGLTWLNQLQTARRWLVEATGELQPWQDTVKTATIATGEIGIATMMIVDGQKKYADSWITVLPQMQVAVERGDELARAAANRLDASRLQAEYEKGITVDNEAALRAVREILALKRRENFEAGKLQAYQTANLRILQAMTQSALALGDTLVEAAFGAKVAWGDFFVELLKMFAKAIVQALILLAIEIAIKALGGASGGGQAASGGEVAAPAAEGGYVHAAGGLQISGPRIPRDSVRALLMPGEVVLRTPVVEEIERTLEGRARGRGQGEGMTINNNFAGLVDRTMVEQFVKMQNKLARNFGLQVVATEVVS